MKGRREGEKKLITLVKLSEIQIIRHVKVKDTASPDDPSLNAYWEKRKTTQGKNLLEQGFNLLQGSRKPKLEMPSMQGTYH